MPERARIRRLRPEPNPRGEPYPPGSCLDDVPLAVARRRAEAGEVEIVAEYDAGHAPPLPHPEAPAAERHAGVAARGDWTEEKRRELGLAGPPPEGVPVRTPRRQPETASRRPSGETATAPPGAPKRPPGAGSRPRGDGSPGDAA